MAFLLSLAWGSPTISPPRSCGARGVPRPWTESTRCLLSGMHLIVAFRSKGGLLKKPRQALEWRLKMVVDSMDSTGGQHSAKGPHFVNPSSCAFWNVINVRALLGMASTSSWFSRVTLNGSQMGATNTLVTQCKAKPGLLEAVCHEPTKAGCATTRPGNVHKSKTLRGVLLGEITAMSLSGNQLNLGFWQ